MGFVGTRWDRPRSACWCRASLDLASSAIRTNLCEENLGYRRHRRLNDQVSGWFGIEQAHVHVICRQPITNMLTKDKVLLMIMMVQVHDCFCFKEKQSKMDEKQSRNQSYMHEGFWLILERTWDPKYIKHLLKKRVWKPTQEKKQFYPQGNVINRFNSFWHHGLRFRGGGGGRGKPSQKVDIINS